MRYDVHNYEYENTFVLEDVPMIVLVQHDFIKTEWMQRAVLALNVGGELLSDKGSCFIRRIS